MLREVKAASAQKECDARQQEETAQVSTVIVHNCSAPILINRAEPYLLLEVLQSC
jgi:hypothetical protein